MMTLQAREQHIRRDKATSNICTNQALMAIRALIFLCCLGKEGMREVGEHNIKNSHFAREAICSNPEIRKKFDAPFFNEFVVELEVSPQELNEQLAAHGILGGVPLGWWYPELEECMLICVTETKTKEQIDRFTKALEELNCRAN